MCDVLDVSPSGYYAWRGRPLVTPRVGRDLALRARIRAIHAATRGSYGSPRVHRALRTSGERVGRKRVIRLMRVDGLRGRPRRRYRVTTQSDAAAIPAANVLQQRFAIAASNTVWAGDITAIPTGEGWVYLAVLLDLWSRRIVGWALRATVDTELVCGALHMALGHRRVAAGLVHHSDRGAQYTAARYQTQLRAAGLRCSMSRRGNCFDNAPVESFFRTLKVEIDERCFWPTRQQATAAVHRYLAFYNRDRLHSSLGYQSPITFEAQHTA